ncbi:hypothetical protein [uncultured Croceitalea sp.]|uniref:hypothetical protein n=1 Tax=uncultured Croceitalea sp. TaxID=1798908 RepID=UPI0033067B43
MLHSFFVILVVVQLSTTILSSCKKVVKNDFLIDKSLSTKVGDITANIKVDTLNFKECYGGQNISQYYAFNDKPYKNGKSHLKEYFVENLNQENFKSFNGLIRIRFIVNCKGETGRYRIHAMNWKYEKQELKIKQKSSIITCLNSYGDFKLLSNNEFPQNYYFYIILKIEEGLIQELLP